MGTKVTLRERAISKGRVSLYLDFYPAITDPETGKTTRREFLGLYKVSKPKNPIDKKSNSQTQKIAEQIASKRHNELNKPEVYADYERERLLLNQKGEENFVEYFTKLTAKRQSSNHDNWVSSMNYLKAFAGDEIRFNQLDKEFCEEFKDYLLNTKSRKSAKSKLKVNSAVSYFNKFKAALKQAYQDEYLRSDLNASVSGIKPEETHRDYLTIEELNSLASTPCNNPILKRAAMFSALTGLRFSDIEKLIWREIRFEKGQGYSIVFRQRKTKGAEVLPISDQAAKLLGEQGNLDDKVFEGLKYSAYSNKHLFQWIGAAGITKDITFHCFRHTYVILQLANGTDIYTVSKLLGHKELKTTQIYAKVIDKMKREAVDKIKIDL